MWSWKKFCLLLFRIYLSIILGQVSISLLDKADKYDKILLYLSLVSIWLFKFRLWYFSDSKLNNWVSLHVCLYCIHLNYLKALQNIKYDFVFRFRYKQDYEKFKVTVTYVVMALAAFMNFVSGYRYSQHLIDLCLTVYFVFHVTRYLLKP